MWAPGKRFRKTKSALDRPGCPTGVVSSDWLGHSVITQKSFADESAEKSERIACSSAHRLAKLRALGHTVQGTRQGDAHSIWVEPKTGVYWGAADRRISGKAAGY